MNHNTVKFGSSQLRSYQSKLNSVSARLGTYVGCKCNWDISQGGERTKVHVAPIVPHFTMTSLITPGVLRFITIYVFPLFCLSCVSCSPLWVSVSVEAERKRKLSNSSSSVSANTYIYRYWSENPTPFTHVVCSQLAHQIFWMVDNFFLGEGGKIKRNAILLKGCGMGPWLVLVSPCLRENVVATYKNWVFFV